MKKTYKSVIIICILSCIFIYFILSYNTILKEFTNYSILFLKTLFPSSFLFLLMSSILIEYDILYYLSRYLKISSKIFIFIISLLSGFPSGAKYTKELLNNNTISIDDTNKIIMFAHFPNLLFILSTCTKLINKEYSIYILSSILLSNLLILLFTSKNNNIKINNSICNKDFSKIIKNSIISTINTIIIIYGTSIFFYLISTIITKYFISYKYIYVLINGLFDLTKGITTTIIIKNNYIKSLYILLFISFGNIPIHIQTKSILSDTNIKYKNYLLGRIISFVLSIIIFNILIMKN